MSKPIIVCVPGSFHSPSSWDAVANLLRKQGYQVLTPPLATCTTTEAAKDIVGKTTLDDAAIVHEHLVPFLDQGAEAVVVSHSYGSVSATIAVEGQTVEERKAKGLKGGIKSLVVIAGFAFPVHGKSVMGDDNDPPVPEWYILRDGVCHLQDSAKAFFYSDLSPEQQDEEWGKILKAHSRASLCAFPTFIASDITVPKTYVLCELDKTLDPVHQEIFTQVGKFDTVVRLQSGHCPLMSMPGKIVDVVVAAGEV